MPALATRAPTIPAATQLRRPWQRILEANAIGVSSRASMARMSSTNNTCTVAGAGRRNGGFNRPTMGGGNFVAHAVTDVRDADFDRRSATTNSNSFEKSHCDSGATYYMTCRKDFLSDFRTTYTCHSESRMRSSNEHRDLWGIAPCFAVRGKKHLCNAPRRSVTCFCRKRRTARGRVTRLTMTVVFRCARGR